MLREADVLKHFGGVGVFNLDDMLAVANGTTKPALLVTIHRWVARGFLIGLRRGVYALPDEKARNPVTPERVANVLGETDSYVTGLWRISQLGFIPEGVVEVTSATRRNPRKLETPMGRYTFRHICAKGFFGFEELPDGDGATVRVAAPEKALLDFLWWRGNDGTWTEAEFARWRINDPFQRINHERLHHFAAEWGDTKLQRAADALTTYLVPKARAA